MIESLLKETGFFTEAGINNGAHQIISISIQVQKRNPFEQFESTGLPEATNSLDYPHETQRDIDVHENLAFYVREITSP